MKIRIAPAWRLAVLLLLTLPLLAAIPQVGEKAPDFALSTVAGKSVRLSEVLAQGPVALVVLRGYPGYQCPFCNAQVHDFIAHAAEFAAAGERVILVYPGPPQDLKARADEFLADKQLPPNFELVIDPGYAFTQQYGLRWDAPSETAYPATFLLDRNGVIFFTKVVKVHGARTTAAEILEALPKPRSAPR